MDRNEKREFRTHLDAHFRQIDLHGELLATVHVRVVALLEGALQLVQLVRGEGGAVAAVLLLAVGHSAAAAAAAATRRRRRRLVLAAAARLRRHLEPQIGAVVRIATALAWNT